MCSICLKSPCDSRCPNADEPQAVHKCEYCGDGIVAGEEYIEYGGHYYHADCVSGMTIDELAKTFDFEVDVAVES